MITLHITSLDAHKGLSQSETELDYNSITYIVGESGKDITLVLSLSKQDSIPDLTPGIYWDDTVQPFIEKWFASKIISFNKLYTMEGEWQPKTPLSEQIKPLNTIIEWSLKIFNEFKYDTKTEKDIMWRRFVKQQTYEEISSDYAISRQRVHQIISKAKFKLNSQFALELELKTEVEKYVRKICQTKIDLEYINNFMAIRCEVNPALIELISSCIFQHNLTLYKAQNLPNAYCITELNFIEKYNLQQKTNTLKKDLLFNICLTEDFMKTDLVFDEKKPLKIMKQFIFMDAVSGLDIKSGLYLDSEKYSGKDIIKIVFGILLLQTTPIHQKDLYEQVCNFIQFSFDERSLQRLICEHNSNAKPSDYIHLLGKGYYSLWRTLNITEQTANSVSFCIQDFLCKNPHSQFSDKILFEKFCVPYERLRELDKKHVVSAILFHTKPSKISYLGRFYWKAGLWQDTPQTGVRISVVDDLKNLIHQNNGEILLSDAIRHLEKTRGFFSLQAVDSHFLKFYKNGVKYLKIKP